MRRPHSPCHIAARGCGMFVFFLRLPRTMRQKQPQKLAGPLNVAAQIYKKRLQSKTKDHVARCVRLSCTFPFFVCYFVRGVTSRNGLGS